MKELGGWPSFSCRRGGRWLVCAAALVALGAVGCSRDALWAPVVPATDLARGSDLASGEPGMQDLRLSPDAARPACQAPLLVPQLPAPKLVAPCEGAIASGDIDRDGHVDLVLALGRTAGLDVLYGNGDGTFGERVTVSTGKSYAGQVRLGDFNKDGQLDVAVVAGTEISILLATGNRRFAHSWSYSTLSPISVELGDLDEDGRLDAVASNLTSRDVDVYTGRGDGTMVQHDAIRGIDPRGVALADFHRDGHLDVAALTSGGWVGVYRGDGKGHFDGGMEFLVAKAVDLWALHAEDFNGDGRMDLAFAAPLEDYVAVLLARPDGRFEASQRTTAVKDLRSLASGDFDGDGVMDLVVGQYLRPKLGLMLGRGDGTFGPPIEFAVDGSGYLESMVTADFNEDGKLDVAVGGSGFTSVPIFLGACR